MYCNSFKGKIRKQRKIVKYPTMLCKFPKLLFTFESSLKMCLRHKALKQSKSFLDSFTHEDHDRHVKSMKYINSCEIALQ